MPQAEQPTTPQTPPPAYSIVLTYWTHQTPEAAVYCYRYSGQEIERDLRAAIEEMCHAQDIVADAHSLGALMERLDDATLARHGLTEHEAPAMHLIFEWEDDLSALKPPPEEGGNGAPPS